MLPPNAAARGAALEVVRHDDAGSRGLGDVDVAVDTARQHQAPGRIDDLGGLSEVVAERRDLLPANADVAGEGVGLCRDRAAADDGVETHAHQLPR